MIRTVSEEFVKVEEIALRIALISSNFPYFVWDDDG